MGGGRVLANRELQGYLAVGETPRDDESNYLFAAGECGRRSRSR